MMKPYEGTEAYKAGFEDGKKPQWICTKYTLPPVPMCSAQELDGMTYYTSDPVLVCDKDGHITIASFGMADHGDSCWVGEFGDTLTGIVAWMNLPEAYEEEENE